MGVDRKTGQITHHGFSDILNLLSPGDLLVLNDTRVIPAKISARRSSGGKVDILLIKPESRKEGHWQAMASPLRKLRVGEVLAVSSIEGNFSITIAGFFETEDGQRRVIVDLGAGTGVYELLSSMGNAPLPPYIHRELLQTDTETEHRKHDLERYQTVFARSPGAVAAPTAGLHFSPELLEEIRQKGIEICFVTLHVGPGTFKPVTTNVQQHSVETEAFSISDETVIAVNRARDEGRRVIAVGTTSCRALESAGSTGKVTSISDGNTSLYIKPGHQFSIVDALITNFHLSRSSLLILVSAFAGRDLIMNAYEIAVAHRYRFYSYGDAMFIQ